jgi:hypothetical protein
MFAQARAVSAGGSDDQVYEASARLADAFEEAFADCMNKLSSEGLLVTPALSELQQRHVENWCVCDASGTFIPPWFGADAVAPGGLFGVLVPSPLSAKHRVGMQCGNQGQWEPAPRFRVSVLEEWHSQTVDYVGVALPSYWIRSGQAWYRLGRPMDAYASFLLHESAWLLATYRSAMFLTQCPKASFHELIAVLSGRNWLRSSSIEGGAGSNVGAFMRMFPISAEVLVEKAAMIASEVQSMHSSMVIIPSRSPV